MPPDDPVVGGVGLLDCAFTYLFNRGNAVSSLKFSKCPVPVSVVVVSVGFFCSFADVYSLRVELVHVVQEREIVIRERVLRVYLDASLEVFNSHRVLLQFKIYKAKVVI